MNIYAAFWRIAIESSPMRLTMTLFVCLVVINSDTTAWDLSPALLPGASNFTMTIYGAPSTPPDLEALIKFIKAKGLGQALLPTDLFSSSLTTNLLYVLGT